MLITEQQFVTLWQVFNAFNFFFYIIAFSSKISCFSKDSNFTISTHLQTFRDLFSVMQVMIIDIHLVFSMVANVIIRLLLNEIYPLLRISNDSMLFVFYLFRVFLIHSVRPCPHLQHISSMRTNQIYQFQSYWRW